jgi:deoxyribonuclease-1
MLILLLGMAYQGAQGAPCYQSLLTLDHSTFFCEQPFSNTGELNAYGKHQPTLSEKITCMYLVPLKNLAPFYGCYHQKCINKKGKVSQGLRCCKQDSQFQQMQKDLHNLVPETKQLKQQRERYTFAELNSASKKAGCHFVIDKKTKRLEPASSKRGMIARAYLYMKDTYPFRLNDEEMALYLKWHQQYPVTQEERERNDKIFQMQGKKNHWIK